MSNPSSNPSSPFDEAAQLAAAGQLDDAIERLTTELDGEDTSAGRRRLAAFLLVAERPDDAAVALERSIELATASRADEELAESRFALGRVRARQGEHRAALELLDAACRQERELDARGLRAACLHEIGELHATQNRWTRAAQSFERAAEVAAARAQGREHAAAMERLTQVLIRARRWQDAEVAAATCLEVSERAEDDELLARALAHAGWLADRHRDPRRADECYARSVELALKVEDRQLAAEALADQADANLRARMPRPAAVALERAIELTGDLGNKAMSRGLNELLAQAYRDLGEFEAANAALDTALALARDGGADVPRVLSELAEISFLRGAHDTAIGLQKECVSALHDAGDQKGEARAELRLGQSALDHELWAEATTAFDRSLGLADAIGDTGLQARALSGKAAVLERRGDRQLAVVFHSRRLGFVRDGGDQQGVALALLDIARAQRADGRIDAAMTSLLEALEAARSARRRLTEAEVQHELGLCATADGATRDARRYLRDSARSFLEAGRTRQAHRALDDLAATMHEGSEGAVGGQIRDVVDAFLGGSNRRARTPRLLDGARVLLHFGLFDAAHKRLDEAMADLDREPDARLRGAVLQAFGQASRLAGDSESAVAQFGARVELERERSHPRELAYALNSLAAARVDVGAVEEALSAFEESLALMEQIGDQSGLAVVLNGIATPLHLAGRSDDALAALERGLAIQQHGRRESDVSVTLNTRGEILRELGRLDDAIADLERCLELTEAANDERGLAFVLPRLGRARFGAGQAERALQDLERGVEIALRNPDRRQAVRALSAFGEVLVESGDTARAREPLEDAVAMAEELGAKDLAESARTSLARVDGA